MSSEIFSIFDAWEPLLKARKAKGLDKWSRLAPIADKLQGKGVDSISFTCAHPSHGGNPVRHLLGSVEGNLHFLMGYGNPKFHLAPYHVHILDPNITEEEAQEAFDRLKHPANPVVWARAGLTVGDEGDTTEGRPHSAANQPQTQARTETKRKATSIKAISPTGTYTCYPEEGLVENDATKHVYRWDLVKDTFFTAQNPQVVEVMNDSSLQKSKNALRFKEAVPDEVRAYASLHKGASFTESVWPLVQSRMPKPGSIMKLESKSSETVYAIVTDSSIDFYDRSSSPVEVSLFDSVSKSLDLTNYCSTPPAALLSFMSKHCKISPSWLKEVSESLELSKSTLSFPSWVEGEPSPGFENCPAGPIESVNKSVILDGDTLRVVMES